MLLAQGVDPNQVHRFLTGNDYTVAGVLVVALLAIGYGFWRACSWLGKEVLVPSRDRGFKHLDAVDSTMKDISVSLQRLSEIPGRLDRIEGKVDGVVAKVDDLSERVDGLDEHMKLQDAKLSTKERQA